MAEVNSIKVKREQTVWYWQKNRHIHQWNRIESSEINPSLYNQLIFDKEGRSIQWGKNSLFNKWCWENWPGTCKKNETRTPTYIIYHNDSRWIKDLNISHDTIKVLEENIGSKISDIPRNNIFADIFIFEIKEKINKWDCIKLKSFCVAKETIIKMKREPTVWENIFVNDTLGSSLISKTC